MRCNSAASALTAPADSSTGRFKPKSPSGGTNFPVTRGNSLQASVVKGYVRHDIFVQRIYDDMPQELEARYGKGVLSLGDVLPEIAPAEAERAPG
jgi:HTH-type transcriptional regulator, sugar sensing transcriptional regulator